MSVAALQTPPASADPTARTRAAAIELEAGFIGEMLRAAGAGRTPGYGSDEESEFASFLIEARAREMAEAGGLGLAEAIFDSMVRDHAGQ